VSISVAPLAGETETTVGGVESAGGIGGWVAWGLSHERAIAARHARRRVWTRRPGITCGALFGELLAWRMIG
jgi:hypothetical protein